MCFRPAQATAGETGERGTACYNRREMIDGKPGERESIWSVPSSWHGWYLGVFALFTVFSAGYICWEEFHNPENEGFYETFLAMGHAASPFVILSAGLKTVQELVDFGISWSLPVCSVLLSIGCQVNICADMIYPCRFEKRSAGWGPPRSVLGSSPTRTVSTLSVGLGLMKACRLFRPMRLSLAPLSERSSADSVQGSPSLL